MKVHKWADVKRARLGPERAAEIGQKARARAERDIEEAAKHPRRYVATWSQDEDGVWCGIVDFGENISAISDGDTLELGKARMVEAVALTLDCSESEFELEHRIEP